MIRHFPSQRKLQENFPLPFWMALALSCANRPHGWSGRPRGDPFQEAGVNDRDRSWVLRKCPSLLSVRPWGPAACYSRWQRIRRETSPASETACPEKRPVIFLTGLFAHPFFISGNSSLCLPLKVRLPRQEKGRNGEADQEGGPGGIIVETDPHHEIDGQSGREHIGGPKFEGYGV